MHLRNYTSSSEAISNARENLSCCHQKPGYLSSHFSVMPDKQMTTSVKTEQSCPGNAAGSVPCRGIGSKSVVERAHDKRGGTNGLEGIRTQPLPKSRIVTQARRTS